MIFTEANLNLFFFTPFMENFKSNAVELDRVKKQDFETINFSVL